MRSDILNKKCEIIIYVDNNWHRARSSIDNVLEKTKDVKHHITIIDDASNQHVSNNLKEYSNINSKRLSIIRNEIKLGNTRSINKAIKRTNSQFIALVSTKTCVTANWLNKMLNCLNSSQKIGICVPLTNNSEVAQVNLLPGMDILRLATLLEEYSQKSYPYIPFAEPYLLVFSRKLINKIGHLDEKFLDFYLAVKDFSYRTKYHGLGITCSDDVFVFFSEDKAMEKLQNNNDKNIFESRWNKRLKMNDNIEICADKISNLINDLNDAILKVFDKDFSKKYLKHKKVIEWGSSLNILCILPTLNPYGGVISVINLLNQLIEMGHNCTLISLSPCDNHPHIFYGEPVYVPNWNDIPEKFEGYYDVLIATSWETVDYIGKLRDKSNYGYTYYFVQDLEETFYDEDDVDKKQAVRATYDQMDVKFVKTKSLYKEIEKLTENIFRIRPGMNLDLFYPQKNIDNEYPVILAMVRYGHYHRGFDLVLETLNKVSAKRPNSKIILFGSDQLDNLPVNFKYTNYGRVKPEQLPDLYSSADIFLEMSRHHGFGRTGVEAMACGTACVLSDSEGINEYAVDNNNAFIVPTGDIDLATERICFLIDNPKKKNKMVLEGLKTIKEFSDREAAKDFLKLVYNTHPLVPKK